MKTILKLRWLILILWIGAAIALTLMAPSMGSLVREKGGLTVPDNTSSKLAYQILDEKNPDNHDRIDIVLVFHNDTAFTSEQLQEAEKAVEKLDAEKANLGIKKISSSFLTEELKDQLVTKDKKTILTLLSVDRSGREAAVIRNQLEDVLKGYKVEHYLTGGTLVDEDVVVNSENGLHKTEFITVAFILLILLLVFRSPITPFIPLFIVGISYVISQALIAYFIDWWNFPVSQFSQVFLVAVLFGIGTDYCILLLSRFKEEITHQPDIKRAIIRTYQTAGKTVFFSALAALIGFALIGLAKFNLYQSAVAVSVGVAVLIIALLTLVPFFMAVLGKHLFWPTKGSIQHRDSKLWGKIGQFSISKPFLALALIAIIVVPLLISYDGKLSFNSLNEISDKYDSVKGFNIIADSFGPGEAMPTKIVIEHDQPLDNKESLAVIEKISRQLAMLPEVTKVRSATRPLGDPLQDFLVTSQVKQLDDGLDQGQGGINQIRDGLADANQALTTATPQMQSAVTGMKQLIDGTSELKNGTVQLRDGLAQIEQGLRKGSLGADQLEAGLAQAKENAAKLQDGAKQLLQGYKQMGAGLGQLGDQYKALLAGLQELTKAYSQLDGNFTNILKKYPDLSKDMDFLTIQGTVNKAKESTNQIAQGLTTLNGELGKVITGLDQSNAGLGQLVTGLDAFTKGLGDIQKGMEGLNKGILSAADGQKQVLQKLPAMINGLDQLVSGQGEAQTGFVTLINQLGELNNGLTQSVDGLTKISDGIGSAKGYLTELSESPDQELAGWNLPEEALNNKDFQKIYDTYMSADRKVTTIDVILKNNPYSIEAIHSIKEIKKVIDQTVKGTELEGIRYGVGGITGMFADLESTSSQDYQRTMILMLIGIALILVILLRSLIMPIYLIAALLLCYFTSMAFSEFIFGTVFDYGGIGWTIPFFGFVILLALGVDYSIFLMDRFNEHRDLSITDAIILAMKKMGTVITSAAIILAGTFAAMYPSGVLSMLQIATVVLTGLILYALVFLPFFVPVMVKLFGKANWWPFIPSQKKENSVVPKYSPTKEVYESK